MAELKVGARVYAVVKLSKFMFNIEEGMVVGVGETEVAYSVNGSVHFAANENVFLNKDEAAEYAKKLALDGEKKKAQ